MKREQNETVDREGPTKNGRPGAEDEDGAVAELKHCPRRKRGQETCPLAQGQAAAGAGAEATEGRAQEAGGAEGRDGGCGQAGWGALRGWGSPVWAPELETEAHIASL